jgi:hypothetical protein
MPPSTTMAVHTNCLYNVHECTGPEPRRTGMHHKTASLYRTLDTIRPRQA